MHGNATPSPKPITTRHKHRKGMDFVVAANGVAIVANDQMSKPPNNTLAPPILSANTPPNIGVSAYPNKKDDCIKPNTLTSHPFILDMGKPAMDIITRSALHKSNASATKNKIVNR